MMTIASNQDLLNTLIEFASHPNKDDEENVDGVMQYAINKTLENPFYYSVCYL